MVEQAVNPFSINRAMGDRSYPVATLRASCSRAGRYVFFTSTDFSETVHEP